MRHVNVPSSEELNRLEARMRLLSLLKSFDLKSAHEPWVIVFAHLMDKIQIAMVGG